MTLTMYRRHYLTKALEGTFTICTFDGTSGLDANGAETCASGSQVFFLTVDGLWISNGNFQYLTAKAFFPWR